MDLHRDFEEWQREIFVEDLIRYMSERGVKRLPSDPAEEAAFMTAFKRWRPAVQEQRRRALEKARREQLARERRLARRRVLESLRALGIGVIRLSPVVGAAFLVALGLFI